MWIQNGFVRDVELDKVLGLFLGVGFKYFYILNGIYFIIGVQFCYGLYCIYYCFLYKLGIMQRYYSLRVLVFSF